VFIGYNDFNNVVVLTLDGCLIKFKDMFITKNNYADFKSVGKNKKNAQTSFTNAGSAVEGGWGRASQGEFRIFLEQLLDKF
jgi:hypothetical protein